ncbi:hypothetical protein [Brevibacterium album]|uniref:hypothetical protein n=1 Tax=Brevibacterium album TaxID=417948 RepID=UPI00041B9FB4|nr:hypothetical protein [Brevibacterium album]
MSSDENIRHLSLTAAQIAVGSIEFLDVVEEADAGGYALTEDEIEQAHRLACDAKVVIE